MTRISINGKEFGVTEFDDDTSILERYSLTVEGSIPHFFSITNRDFRLENGVEIVIENIMDALKDVPEGDINKNWISSNLLPKFPNLSLKSIALVWLVVHRKVYVDERSFRSIDAFAFTTESKITEAIGVFEASIKEERKNIAEKVAFYSKDFEILDNIDSSDLNIGKLNVDTLSISTSLKFDGDSPLIEVFDALKVSINLPFIYLYYNGRDYYKIFSGLSNIPSYWVTALIKKRDDAKKAIQKITKLSNPEVNVMYFKVLSPSYQVPPEEDAFMDKLYSTGEWSSQNLVGVEFNAKFVEEEKIIITRILSSITRLKYQILEKQQTGIGCTFSVEFNFNNAIFSDFLINQVSVNEGEVSPTHFFFFDESGKAVVSKKRFVCFYKPVQNGDKSDAVRLSITPKDDTSKNVTIRISRARTYQTCDAMRHAFGKFLKIYGDHATRIQEEYAKFIPDLTKLLPKKEKEKKKDMKTGIRLEKLKNQRPALFVENFSKQCSPNKQVYLLTPEQLDRFKAKYPPDGGHHILNYPKGSTDWYACEPRDGGERGISGFIWPGLQLNKKGDRVKFKYVPCCFVKDQYTKKGGLKSGWLKKYLSETEGKEVITRTKPVSGIGYILASTDVLLEGRYGELPFFMNKILKGLGYKLVTLGRKEYYPVLLHVVQYGPDSVLYLLERALNPSYLGLTKDARALRVKTTKQNLSKMDLTPAKQELYDFDENAIKEYLKGDNFIDPRMFISLLEIYYKCTIFLYIVDEENPDGNIQLPRHSVAYIPKPYNENKPVVIILLYEDKSVPYRYQCEIVTKLTVSADGAMKNIEYKFEGSSPLALKCRELLLRHNSINEVDISAGTILSI